MIATPDNPYGLPELERGVYRDESSWPGTIGYWYSTSTKLALDAGIPKLYKLYTDGITNLY